MISIYYLPEGISLELRAASFPQQSQPLFNPLSLQQRPARWVAWERRGRHLEIETNLTATGHQGLKGTLSLDAEIYW